MQGELSVKAAPNSTETDPILQISLGTNIRSGKIRTKDTRWRAFVDRFREPLRAEESAAQFAALAPLDQGVLKGVPGYYVGATFSDGHRRRDELVLRTMLTLDLDFCPVDFDPALDLAIPDDVTYLIHTTRTHDPVRGIAKWRMVVPLSSPIDGDLYEPLARAFAQRVGIIDLIDPTCYRPAQLMYWPSTHSDGVYDLFVSSDDADGLDALPLLDAGPLLGGLDLDAPESWPRGARDVSVPKLNKGKLDDPRNKPGLIGAYCRSRTIYDVLEQVIPGVYEETGHIDRYRFHGSTGNDGAEVYDGGLYFFSHHDSDPAGDGHSHNAFDLARIHLYGHLDEGVEADTASALPSFKAMAAHAEGDAAVQVLLAAEEDDLFDVEPELTEAGEVVADDTEVDLARSLADFDGVEIPQTQFHLYPYVPKERYTMVSGPGGVGKTSFVIQLALEMASGVAVLHDRESRSGGEASVPALKPVPVLLVSSEDHTNICVSRARAVLSSPLYAEPDDPAFWEGGAATVEGPAELKPIDRQRAKRNFYIMDAARSKEPPSFVTISREYGSTPRLKPTSFLQRILRTIDKYHIKVLIIDNLGAVFPGSINDDEALRPFLHRVLLTELAHKRGVTPILIHHNNKAGARTGGPGEYAGSQYLSSSAASVLQLTVSKGDPEIKELFHTKSNYARSAGVIPLKYHRGALCPATFEARMGEFVLRAATELVKAGRLLRWRVGATSVYHAAKLINDHTRTTGWSCPVVPKHEAEAILPRLIEAGALVEAYVENPDPHRRGKDRNVVALFPPTAVPAGTEVVGVFDSWDSETDAPATDD